MPKSSTDTRARIMDAAEGLILSRGYAGTSLDEILSGADLTKGAFFHHFDSKRDLARSLVTRYAEQDAELLLTFMQRAERLSRDPLQQLLIFLGLYEEAMEEMTESFPGCLFASYAYQAGLFDEETNQAVRDAMLFWRDSVAVKFREVIRTYGRGMPVTAEDLADSVLALFEGAYVISLTLKDHGVIARQIRLYRNYLELLFGGASSVQSAPEGPAE